MKTQTIIDALGEALDDIQPCRAGTGPSHETTNVIRARMTLEALIATLKIEAKSAPVGSAEPSKVTHDEETLRKVYSALLFEGIYGLKAVDVVSSLQNVGILFRERS